MPDTDAVARKMQAIRDLARSTQFCLGFYDMDSPRSCTMGAMADLKRWGEHASNIDPATGLLRDDVFTKRGYR